jgi:RNA polymerase sigma-70 factor, ECF subfamily
MPVLIKRLQSSSEKGPIADETGDFVSSDKNLLDAARCGLSPAFDELFHRHSREVFRVLRRIMRTKEDAEDALQDSLLRAFTRLDTFDGRASFSTWLTRIAINSGLMILRKNRTRQEISIAESCDDSVETWPLELAGCGPTPETVYIRHEKEALLIRAIANLRPAIRKVIEIGVLQERSMQETARALGISVSAAKGRLFQARRLLQHNPELRAHAQQFGFGEDG